MTRYRAEPELPRMLIVGGPHNGKRITLKEYPSAVGGEYVRKEERGGAWWQWVEHYRLEHVEP